MLAGRSRRALTLGVAVLLMALLAAPCLGGARGAATSLPLSGGLTGPSNVGQGLKATYTVTAHGGPAEAANGSAVGTYSYQASISAVNTQNASITPISGVLIDFTVALTLSAPNVTEPLTIYVLVKSILGTQNVSSNFSFSVQIIQPFRLTADLIAGATAAVNAFDLTVLLDNQPVGTIVVHALSAGQSYPITFAYVGGGLSAGWHTFSVSLAAEHGLVTFASGDQLLSVSFFVTGGGPDYSFWYLSGLTAFVGAIVIWSTLVSGRRRRPAKK